MKATLLLSVFETSLGYTVQKEKELLGGSIITSQRAYCISEESGTKELNTLLEKQQPGMVASIFNPAFGRQREADLYLFNISLGYTGRPCLKNRQIKKQTNNK